MNTPPPDPRRCGEPRPHEPDRPGRRSRSPTGSVPHREKESIPDPPSPPAGDDAPRRSERWLQVVIDHVPALISYIDRDQRYRFNNKAYPEWFGVPANDLLGKHVRDVLGEEIYLHRVPYIEAALRGEQVRFEGPTRDTSGRVWHTEIAYVPEVVGGGETAGFFVLVHDISERKRAELALRESEERFRTMADAAPVLIWMSGSDGIRTYFNETWLEFTGRAPVQEMRNGWAEGLHPSDVDRCLATYEGAFDRREPFRMEYRLRRADGEYRWLLDHGVQRLAPDGTFAGYIGSCVDINDRKLAEQELLASRERLRSFTSRAARDEGWERRRISQRLHDTISQTLAIAQMQLGTLKGSTPDPVLTGRLEDVHRLIAQALLQSNSLTGEISPPILYELGLEAAIEWLVEEAQRATGVVVAIEDDGRPKPMTEEIRLLVFQAVRELLNELAGRFPALPCTLRLTGRDGQVRVEIDAPGASCGLGRPTHPGAEEGHPLLGLLRERLIHVGGHLEVRAAPGGGTSATVVAPLCGPHDEGPDIRRQS